MATFNLFIDITNEEKTSLAPHTFQQGNNNAIFNFTLTEDGIPVIFDDSYVDMTYEVLDNDFVIGVDTYTITLLLGDYFVYKGAKLITAIVDNAFEIDGIAYTIDSERTLVSRTAYKSLEAKCFIANFNRLDFKSNIKQTTNVPTITFEQDGETPSIYYAKIVVDTSSITEVFENYYKNQMSFMINEIENDITSLFSMTSPFDYYVKKNTGYIINSFSTSNNEE